MSLPTHNLCLGKGKYLPTHVFVSEYLTMCRKRLFNGVKIDVAVDVAMLQHLTRRQSSPHVAQIMQDSCDMWSKLWLTHGKSGGESQVDMCPNNVTTRFF